VIGRKSLYHVLIAAVVLAIGSGARAQAVPAGNAKDLLTKGIACYRALNFQDAQTSLLKASDILKADQATLSEAEQKQLADHLAQIPNAIRRQAAAMEAYRGAERALTAGELADAVQGFAQAATSEFLTEPMRRDAQAQMALAKKRKEVVDAATASPASVATPAMPIAAPVATPVAARPELAAAPVVAPKPVAVPEITPAPMAVTPAPAATIAPTAPVVSDKSPSMTARQAKARQMLAQGKQLLDDKKIAQAAGMFQRAKDLDPDLAEVDQLLAYSSKMTAQKSASEAGVLSQLERRNEIARQAAMVDIAKQAQRAREGLTAAKTEADYNNAEQSARSSLDILQASKSIFGAMEYRNEDARIQGLLTQIANRREAFNRSKAASVAREIERVKGQRMLDQQRQKVRKITTLSEQAKVLRSQQKYDQALDIVEQVLLIDSANTWAANERELLTEFSILQKDVRAFRTVASEEARANSDVRVMETPWYEYLRYPRNWKQLTEDRKEFQASAAGETPADAALREKLKREIERLSFADIDFKDVIEFLREYSNANIHVNWRALTAAGIEQTTKVSVDVRKITVKRALDLVLRDVSGAAAGADAELRYVVDGGVLTISTKSDLAKEPIRRVYDIRDLLVPVPDFEGPKIQLSEVSEAASEAGGDSGGGGGGGGGIFDEDDMSERRDEEMTKDKLMENFISLVRNSIDPESWADPQGGAGVGTPGFIQILGGSLVVTQTAQNHQALSELIEKLREAKTIQILIEARFITVDSSFLNSVGVDLDFYFNLGSNMSQGAATDPWTGASVPGTGGSAWGPGHSGNNKFSPIGAQQGSIAFINGVSTGTGTNIGSMVGAPALSIGGTFLDDIQVDFLVQATQARASTRQLNAPRITLSNSQRSYITVARQQAYIREYIPMVSGNSTAYRPIVDYIPTGAVLDVAATASADRRYVMMTIRPQVSVQEGQPRVLYIGFDPEDVTSVSGDAQSLPIELPTVVIQQLETSVSVPDGGTLLLGGQTSAGEATNEMGAPLLSKIPIISRMFENRAVVRDQRTLLILVKPKIMINEQAERNEKLYLEAPRMP